MMSHANPLRLVDLDPRTRQAIAELERTILTRFPTTTFVVERNPDDSDSIHLLAIADVDDPDEVGDLVVDRVVTLHVVEGIPVHVIPLRTPERVHDAMTASPGTHRRSGRAVRLAGISANSGS